MPVIGRRRRTQAANDDDSVASTPQPTQTQRRRRAQPEEEEEDEDVTMIDGETQDDGASVDQMAKKLVRLALACEYSRTPIRRGDISAKVLGTQARKFKPVFDAAQLTLQSTFGMEMVELPQKEKTTLQQRRQAFKSDKAPSTSKSYILTSTLPEAYRNPIILAPAKIPTASEESTYVGLVTFIVTLVYLSGGTLPDEKLLYYLKRVSAERETPLGSVDKLLKRMEKDLYLQKSKETNQGEETIEWFVGPRGRVEVGESGASGVVKCVYGEQDEGLEAKLERSLGLNVRPPAGPEPVQVPATQTQATQRRKRGRPRREVDGEEDE